MHKKIGKKGKFSLVEQWVINGKFNTKAAYEHFRPRGTNFTWPKLVWHSSLIPKHSFILWLRDRLLTRDKLQGLIVDQTCPLCNAADESIDHLFFQCNVGKYVWLQIKQWLGISRAMSTLKAVVKWITKEARGTGIQAKAKKIGLACSVYCIWKARNEMIFEGKIKQPNAIVRCIQTQLYRVTYNCWKNFN